MSFQIPESPFDELIGTQWVSDDPDNAIARFETRPELRQPIGLTHGGVLSSVIESVCSRATAIAVWEEGMTAMGQSASINFLRPPRDGTVEVRAVARHRGRTSWVWAAEVWDSDDRLCALGQMTIAVRKSP